MKILLFHSFRNKCEHRWKAHKRCVLKKGLQEVRTTIRPTHSDNYEQKNDDYNLSYRLIQKLFVILQGQTNNPL